MQPHQKPAFEPKKSQIKDFTQLPQTQNGRNKQPQYLREDFGSQIALESPISMGPKHKQSQETQNSESQ